MATGEWLEFYTRMYFTEKLTKIVILNYKLH